MKIQRRYNWKPDLPDARDQKYQIKQRFVEKLSAVSKVDLREKCPPVVDQGDIGSCTGNALAGALGFNEWLAVGGPKFQPFSRLFIYYNERAIEGTVGQDAGASIRDGIKTLAKQGACFESLWPYSDLETFQKPSKKAYTQAAGHKIAVYKSLNGIDAVMLKNCLAQGLPFVFGFTVYESFESQMVAKTGVMPMPKPTEQVLGGHAVMCVGYDDDRSVFIVRNSWGTGWGDQGHFYMPYPYMLNNDLTEDHWMISK